MALPDFLIIGAMKCGTSTLQAQLAAQPGVFMCTPKEPNFFSDDAIFAKGQAWYESLFDPAQPGDLKGEASTHYTKLPTHPETLPRLRAALHEARLIYMIRNPLVRSVSHYIHEWTQGVISGDLDAAFETHPELIAYSRYATQIAPWVEIFGRDAILLVTLEEMTRDPQAVLSRVGTFLEHPGPLIWREERDKMNDSAERMRRLPLQGLLIDNPVATALRRTLVPKTIRTRIRQSRQIRARPELTAARRRNLETLFTEDHAQLSALFPDTPCLAAVYPFLAHD